MSDRVVVMHERRLKGVLERHELTQLAIASLMTGRDQVLDARKSGAAEVAVS